MYLLFIQSCVYFDMDQFSSVQSLSHVQLFATPWIIESMEFSRPEYRSGYPFSSPSYGSVQFSHSVMSDSLRPHESQHARPPCPSPTPGVHSNSCPLSQWCHPAISSCCPLLLLPSIPPSIRVFSNESTLRMRWPKYWCFSFSIIPSNEHPGLISFRMDWLDLLQSKGLSRVFSNTTVQKHQFFGTQLSS